MAIAKKCDVCGDFYEVYNTANNSNKVNGLLFLNIDEKGKYFTHQAIDCCPECIQFIKNYVESLKTSR